MYENFYGGLSGLVLPVTKKDFPIEFRDRSRIEYYASIFNSIEINSSFYKLPQQKTVAKWAAAVPENFTFTYKMLKEISHSKQLEFNEAQVAEFMNTISPAAGKTGCILLQLPPSATIDLLNQLQSLLSEIKFYNIDGWQTAVEFRHPSWYEQEVLEIIEEYDAICVAQDMPKAPTAPGFVRGNKMYYRFHGPLGNYRSSYEEGFLAKMAGTISQALSNNKTVYAYFNNTMGDAVKNLRELSAFIQQAYA